MINLEDAIGVIENCAGFDDPTSGVGEAWDVIKNNIILRCETCMFFIKSEWSDDIGWLGYCSDDSHYVDGDIVQSFGCVNWKARK